MMASGIIYLLALVVYIYALKNEEASTVIPLFQLSPIISYVFGFIFLQEYLNFQQIVASLVVITGAVLISIDMRQAAWKFKLSVFLLMFLSSVLFSLNSLIFKITALQSSFWAGMFWQYVGTFIAGCALLLLSRQYRSKFLYVLRNHRLPALSLIALTEGLTFVGRSLFSFATLLAPLALVSVVGGLQPAFVFIYGVVLTIFFPGVSNEDISRKALLQKFTAIGIIFVGTCLLVV